MFKSIKVVIVTNLKNTLSVQQLLFHRYNDLEDITKHLRTKTMPTSLYYKGGSTLR